MSSDSEAPDPIPPKITSVSSVGGPDLVEQFCDRCGPSTYSRDAMRLTCPACGRIYRAVLPPVQGE